jgi:hypothetical protein
VAIALQQSTAHNATRPAIGMTVNNI